MRRPRLWRTDFGDLGVGGDWGFDDDDDVVEAVVVVVAVVFICAFIMMGLLRSSKGGRILGVNEYVGPGSDEPVKDLATEPEPEPASDPDTDSDVELGVIGTGLGVSVSVSGQSVMMPRAC